MLPSHHALAATLAAVPLARRGWPALHLAAFWSGAVLIDVDHYLSYALREGDWSLRNAYRFHRGRVPPFRRWGFRPRAPSLWAEAHRPFHPLAVLAAAFALGARWPLVRALAWGMILHRATDYLYESIGRAQAPDGVATRRA